MPLFVIETGMLNDLNSKADLHKTVRLEARGKLEPLKGDQALGDREGLSLFVLECLKRSNRTRHPVRAELRKKEVVVVGMGVVGVGPLT